MNAHAAYDLQFVIISIIVAFLAAYASLTLFARAQNEEVENSGIHFVLGTIIAGAGIWTMHFIGMFSYHPLVVVSYHVWLVILSLFIAVFFSLLSFSLVLRSAGKKKMMYLGGMSLGLSIPITHYAGMAAMKVDFIVEYELVYVVLSVMISIILSLAAIFFTALSKNQSFHVKQNILAGSITLAAAISGMHYMGMYAMRIHVGGDADDPHQLALSSDYISISSDGLALWLGIFTFVFIMTILTVSVLDKNKAKKQKDRLELRYQSLIQNSPNIVLSFDMDGIITSVNPKGKEVLMDKQGQLIGKPLEFILDEEDHGKVPTFLKNIPDVGPDEHHLAIRTLDGKWIPMAITFIPITIDDEIQGYFSVGRDISELIQYKDRIKKVQKELLDTVRQQQGMIFKFVKHNGQFIHTLGDGELLRRLGLDTNAILGKSLFDFYPYDMAVEKTKVYEVAWSGQVTHYEGNINGTIYFASLTPVFKEGKVVEVIGSAADVTERKRLEALQKRNEQWYRNILSVMTEGILLYDEKDHMIVLNDNVYDMFEMDKATFLNQKLANNNICFIDESGEPLTFDQYPITYTLKTGKGIQQRVLGIKKDNGKITWVTSSTKRLEPFEEGDTAKVLLTLTDITLQKEQEIKLGESDTLRKTILNSLPVGVLVEDRDRKIVLANDFFRGLFHVEESLSEMEGKDSMPFHQSLLRDESNAYQHIVNIIEQQLPHEEEVETADGRTLRRKYVPYYMNGELKGHLWTYEDTTERKRIIQESILAKEEAIKANHAKSTFLSNMSHELRTPLNGILGFSQLLEIDEDLVDHQRLYVNEILKGGRHLLDLINEVLDLSRIETGRLKVSFKLVKVNALIEECMNLITPAAAKKKITIESELSDCKDSCIKIDEVRFRQIILNLLDNAIKYNHESGRIRIVCKNEHQYLTIHVEDDGFGISEDKVNKIFEPFYRISHSNIEGAGIGLSLVKQLTRLMGGKVGVKSELGKGSDFWISLPLSQPAILTQPSETQKSYLQITTQKEKTILYIEDNPSNVELMEQIVHQIPQLKLMIAENGREGIHKVLEEKVDVILLDIQLPDMSGFEVLSQLQSVGITKKIPVLAVSANAMANDIEMAKAAGFKEYITKPIDIPLLLKKLSQYL
jgi:PAS domain S-box-containing protein